MPNTPTSAVVRHSETVDLEAAIQFLINGGEHDPLRITRQLIERYGEGWAQIEVAMRAPQFIEMLARLIVNARKPASKALVFHPGDHITGAIAVRQFWVPFVGFKPLPEVSIADLKSRALWHRKFAAASNARADWCESVIGMLQSQNVETIGQYQGELPELPPLPAEIEA